MSLNSEIFAVLNVSGVTALVEDRIYPGLAPQNAAKPYLVWRRNGGDPMPTMGGSGARYRQNVLAIAAAETFDEASAIADAVREAFKTGTSALKIHAVGLPVDGFDEATRLFTTAIEAVTFYRP